MHMNEDQANSALLVKELRGLGFSLRWSSAQRSQLKISKTNWLTDVAPEVVIESLDVEHLITSHLQAQKMDQNRLQTI